MERQGHGRKFRELRYVALGRRSQKRSISNARYLARHRKLNTLPRVFLLLVSSQKTNASHWRAAQVLEHDLGIVVVLLYNVANVPNSLEAVLEELVEALQRQLPGPSEQSLRISIVTRMISMITSIRAQVQQVVL